MEKILYKKGEYGLLEYKIKITFNGLKFMSNGHVYYEIISEGKASRTLEEQKILRMNARIRSKLDDGFKETKEQALKGITNQLGLIKPMLAQRFKENMSHHFNDKNFIQPKLDGHRCLMNSECMYSRAGRIIDTLPHIKNEIQLTYNITLDGELYIHKNSLQNISSLVKRQQPDSVKVKYIVYDVYDSNNPHLFYSDRYNLLLELFKNNQKQNIIICETHLAYDAKNIINDNLNKGYEGSILRINNENYGVGKRSKSLIKIKSTMDEDFLCIDIILSERETGYCNFVLENKTGLTFKTPVFGTVENKKNAINEKDKYINKMIECKFANYTEDNIPFHCVALRIKYTV